MNVSSDAGREARRVRLGAGRSRSRRAPTRGAVRTRSLVAVSLICATAGCSSGARPDAAPPTTIKELCEPASLVIERVARRPGDAALTVAARLTSRDHQPIEYAEVRFYFEPIKFWSENGFTDAEGKAVLAVNASAIDHAPSDLPGYHGTFAVVFDHVFGDEGTDATVPRIKRLFCRAQDSAAVPS